MTREPLKIPRAFDVLTEQGRAALIEAIDQTADGFRVEIKPIHKGRRARDNQKGLYWRWVTTMADETGADVRSMDRAMRARFLPVATVEVLGVRHRTLTALDDLEAGEMSFFLERIRALAAEYGVILQGRPGSDS